MTSRHPLALEETEIEDRKQAEALLAGERRLLEMVASGSPLSDVLDALCRLVEQSASGCLCSVLLVDLNNTKLQHGAAPSLPVSLNEAIHTPILSLAGKALGTFAIYQREPGSPTPQHHGLIEQFTHIASIAIERTQNEAALRRSEAFFAEAQRLSSTGSFSWRVATGEITWSEQTYRIYEIDPAVPVTFELVGTPLHPEEIAWFQELVAQAQRDGKDLEFEHRLQMPDGSIKYLHVVAHANLDQEDQVEYIGAVQDVTDRWRSEEALNKVRSELARVARGTPVDQAELAVLRDIRDVHIGFPRGGCNGST